MGKDKTKPAASTPTPAPVATGGKPPKGHRQRGAGTVITAKPAVVTGDGIVLKAHERLPSQLLHEYCQKEKRPLPKYYPNPPGNKFRVVLHDEKNNKNDLSFATPQSFETASVARDFGALLALFHMQRQFPLERRLPEPYASTWVQMIATEKEQAKGGGKATAAATTTSKPSPTTPTPTETKPKASTNTTTTVNTNQTSAKASNTTSVVVLHKDTADWLCDSCGNQNFAKLASGAVRLKCFKCQSVRTDSCQLVASTADTTTLANTTSSNSGSSTSSSTVAPNSKIIAVKTRAPVAPVDLLKGKTITPITRAEEERAMQEKRATQRRKQLFFDALRRANRPHIVHIPAGLRAKLERILGMATASKYSETEETEQLCLEDVLQTYTESGLFAPDSCDIPAVEQTALLHRVSARLCQAGFAVHFVASTLHEVLLRSASDLLDDALEELETTTTSSTTSSTVGATQVAALFEKLLHQACIKYLCINVEEAQLPDAYNPKHFESQRKLSVVAPTTAAGGGGSSSSAAAVELPVPEAVSQPAIGEVAVEGLDAVQLLVLAELQSICTATTTTAADNVLYTTQHCITALQTATSLLQHCSKEHVSERLSLLSLLLLQEAAQSSNTATPSTVIEKMMEFLNNTTESGGVQTPLLHADYTVFLEECESLVAIFEDACIHTSSVDALLPYHTIQLQVSLEHMQNINAPGRAKTSGVFGTLSALTLHIITHPFIAYPSEIPLIYLHPNSTTQLTATLCSTIHSLQTALRVKAQELVGEMLIFQLHSYLQECLDQLNTLPCVTDMGAVSRSLHRFDAYFNGTAEIVVDSVIGTDKPARSKNTNTTSNTTVMNTDDSDAITIATTTATETTTSTSNNATKSRKSNRSAPNLTSFWSPLPTTTATIPTPTAAITESRRQLPAYSKRSEVITLLQTHRAIVVTGETGCGKTTQVPQYLYEHNAQQRILICQPRRLAAVGVAMRVAEEVGCALGQQVGYMVKGDSQVSVHTRIAFCTYGVLLRRLQCDPTLSAVSTVVLDEVHERGLDSDFTLALLMFAMARRSTLKVILMSATISTAHFAQYLQKWLKVSEVPVMFIPGFTFPVQEVFKNDYEEIVREFKDFIPTVRSGEFESDEAFPDPSNYYIGGRPQKGLIDYDLLTKLIMALAYGYTQHNSVLYKAHGSILVFMPGVPEINKLARLLEQHYNRNATLTSGERVPCLTILPLHGNLSPTEQKLVYKKVKPNELKVVIATNVAEASVTLPDVTVVVDTCRVKEVCMDDELQTSALVMRLAAKDSLRQRKGRAGRVQKGRCFRLITQGTFDKLPEHSVPEILRVSLEKVVLQVKAMMGSDNNLVTVSEKQRSAGVSGGSSNSSSMALLCRCPDVPSESSVLAAEQLLQQIQALDSTTGLLTPLGRHLSALPCMPRVGKLCIYGALLGCVYTATAVAACMTLRTPFLTSQDSEVVRRVQLAKERYGGNGQLRSDFTVLVNLMQAFQETKNKRRFCLDHGVSHERMAELGETQEDLLRGLVELRLLGSVQEGRRVAAGSTGNRNCHLTRMVTATLASGLYPHLAKILRPTKRFVEVSGGTVQRDHLAKEIKFYIPKTELALNQSTDMKIKTIEKISDIRNVDISTDELQRVFIHPSSCNFQNFTFSESNFVMYGERQLVKPFGSLGTLGDSKLYLRDTIEVPVFALLFFGGGLQVDYSSGVVTVDGWIRFTATGRVVAIIQELRAAFDSLLQRKFDEPDTEIAGEPVIELACQLLNTQAQY